MSKLDWSFYNPVNVIFGSGVIGNLSDHLPYQRMLLVTSSGFRHRGVVDKIIADLGSRIVYVLDNVSPNPDLIDIDAQALELRVLNFDAIIALGGGSSIDTAKALSRLLSQPANMVLTAHFRDGLTFEAIEALPLVAIPTTAGTGAEVTPFGTVWDFEKKKKYSVTGKDLYPKFAILDPELSLGLPEEITISSGLDAVSHALESTWNHNASPVTLGLATKSLQLALRALPMLKVSPNDLAARSSMMQASLLAGLAISQTRTALAHSISYPLTTQYDLPHGIACSFSLPVLLSFNARVDDGRLADLAKAVGYGDCASFASALISLFHELEVSRFFTQYVPDHGMVMQMLEHMTTPGRADNNLRPASTHDMEMILKESLSLIKSNYINAFR